MGVDVHVMLIDRRAYSRLADVHRRWIEARDADAVLALLRDALDRVRTLKPPGPSRDERREEIVRRMDALPTTPEEKSEQEQLRRTFEEGARRATEAMERGDTSAAQHQFAELFRTMFAPLKRDDARGALMKALLSLNDDPPGPEVEHLEQLESAIAVFSDPAATPEQRERGVSWIRLLDAYAFAWDREPRADVVVDLLLPFDDSAVLQDLVGMASGEAIPLDESARFFTREQVAAFRDEVRRLPDPAPNRPERVARVRRIVELAASDPGLALATWSG